MDLKEKYALGDQAGNHWYYVSKARMMTHHIPRREYDILDVGAGLGWFSQWMATNGFAKSAICVDPEYSREYDDEVAGKPISYVRQVSSFKSDLVLMMDVLEHVDDDVALLRQYWNAALPGTRFLISVPAFECLWSAHDDHLGHRRRYTVTHLRDVLSKVGASPCELHYYYGTIFPLAATVRLWRRGRHTGKSDMRPVPRLANAALTGICAIECQFAPWNRIAGLSVIATLLKPKK